MDSRVVVQFDQHSPDYRAGYPQISHSLRDKCPAVWSDKHGGYWVIVGRDLIGELAKHPSCCPTTTTRSASAKATRALPSPRLRER